MTSRNFYLSAFLVFPGLLFAADLTQYRDPPAPEGSVLRASDDEVRQAVEVVREQDERPPLQFHTPTLQPASPTPQFFNPQPYSLYGAAPPPRYAGAAPTTRQVRLPVDHLLLQKAFELERVAHELELSGLFTEADAVRRSASSLRASSKGLDGEPGETEKAASPDESATADAELPEPEVELLQYVPSAQPAPQPQVFREPQRVAPQRQPTTTRQPSAQQRSRTPQSPSQTAQQRQRRGEQNSPNAGRQRNTPQDPPERSLLFRRRGRR